MGLCPAGAGLTGGGNKLGAKGGGIGGAIGCTGGFGIGTATVG